MVKIIFFYLDVNLKGSRSVYLFRREKMNTGWAPENIGHIFPLKTDVKREILIV